MYNMRADGEGWSAGRYWGLVSVVWTDSWTMDVLSHKLAGQTPA